MVSNQEFMRQIDLEDRYEKLIMQAVILTEMKMVGNNHLEMLETKNYNNRKKSDVTDSLNGTEIPEERKGQNK